MNPKLGIPPWCSALDLAVFYKNNGAARLLIAARATLAGGTGPAMAHAATANNAEGIRLLYAAGGNASQRTLLGLDVWECAASYGSLSAMEELLQQGHPSTVVLARALDNAMMIRGGSAEVVELLLGLRADVNAQVDLPRDYNRLGRVVLAAKLLQHKLGRTSLIAIHRQHLHGRTPRMAALQSRQYEGAAALIAAGARLDKRNSQNWNAADFARGQSIPGFLQGGLQGDPSHCEAVTSWLFTYSSENNGRVNGAAATRSPSRKTGAPATMAA